MTGIVSELSAEGKDVLTADPGDGRQEREDRHGRDETAHHGA